jgi:SCY1-like protein 1
MLHAARDLPDAVFAAKVTPCIVKLYTSADKAVRVALLENLHKYAHHLSDKVVDEQVYNSMATGFTDEEAFIRELTLKSVLTLAPKLTQRTHASLLKHLSKLQVDEEPAIRANTTILLGNVARFLNESTAKRVLLNAFTRALRDQFPPTRMAGLMALVATIGYYEPGESATRVIPSVAPLTVDPEKDVREQAFKCLETFTTLLKKHSTRLEDGPEAAAAALAAESEKAPKVTGNVLRWAVNAAAKRIGGGGGSSSSGQEMDTAALAGHGLKPEEEAAARGVDMGAKAFSSAAPPPRYRVRNPKP